MLTTDNFIHNKNKLNWTHHHANRIWLPCCGTVFDRNFKLIAFCHPTNRRSSIRRFVFTFFKFSVTSVCISWRYGHRTCILNWNPVRHFLRFVQLLRINCNNNGSTLEIYAHCIHIIRLRSTRIRVLHFRQRAKWMTRVFFS